MSRGVRTRLGLAFAVAALGLSLTAGAVLAGEVTGNGKSLHVEDSKWETGLHARSECAFSGQEDLQFFTDDVSGTPKAEPTRGDPAHAQSWGQIPNEVRAELPAFLHPGMACNPMKAEFPEEP